MASQAFTQACLPVEVRYAAERSWNLLPVKRGGKTPLIKGWPEMATNNVKTLAKWATDYPACNWGVVTGERSGLFILDIDGAPGEASLNAFERRGQHLPPTLTVQTGTGRHLYFGLATGTRIACSVAKIATGLDVRGEGGFAVIPPSIHANGKPYSYAAPGAKIAEAPSWLPSELVKPVSSSGAMFHVGARNNGLTRIAGRLRRRGKNETQIASALLYENQRQCSPPLPGEEVRRIAASMMRYSVGGPDILEIAWARVEREGHNTNEALYRAMVRELGVARNGEPIALPLERMAEYIGCDWTLLRRYRSRDVQSGFLQPVDPAIRHKRAATFIVSGFWP